MSHWGLIRQTLDKSGKMFVFIECLEFGGLIWDANLSPYARKQSLVGVRSGMPSLDDDEEDLPQRSVRGSSATVSSEEISPRRSVSMFLIDLTK